MFRFLGSVYFAVGLIASLALIVVAGTVLESLTDSHRYAVKFAYGSPLFLLLLLLLFVNILLAALSRWPFRKKHIPFLTAHLGLLMVISGVIAKNLFGVQGVMALIAGGTNNEIILPDTFVIAKEARSGQVSQMNLKECSIVHWEPHVKEAYETWIKGDYAYIDGIHPFEVNTGDALPGAQVAIPGHFAPHWDFYACRSDDVAEIAEQVYIKGLTAWRGEKEVPLRQIHFDYSCSTGFVDPRAFVEGEEIALTGPNALLCGGIDLKRTPVCLLVQNSLGDVYFFAFDPHGQVFAKPFYHDRLEAYASYDEGFSGYRAYVKIPFSSHPYGRNEREEARLKILEMALEEAAMPPLQIFKEACLETGHPFGQTLVTFLQLWDREKTDLFPKDYPLPKELNEVMKKLDYSQLPYGDFWGSHIDPAHFLSIYLRASGIFLANLLPKEAPQCEESMVLECPLTLRYEKMSPGKKLEEHKPLLVIEEGQKRYTLAYDRFGIGLKWPIGDALVRFQPRTEKIPYHIRLRDARQINYANTNQPFSYECDLLINDTDEVTLSMNHVYQTWSGYRFYLANVTPSDETRAQRIQLVINRDPAKYFLTYPGAALVALGILLLFVKEQKKETK